VFRTFSKGLSTLACALSVSGIATAGNWVDELSFENKDGALDTCAQTDISGFNDNPAQALACVGFVNGNTANSMDDWNSIRWDLALTSGYIDPDGYNPSGGTLGLFGYSDWLGDGNTPIKCDDENGNCSGIVSWNETNGTIDLDFSSLPDFGQFAVAMKQTDEWAAYLFNSDAAMPLEYAWYGSGGGPASYDLSHITFLYREGGGGTQETPIPAPLLLVAPLAGFLAWRTRQQG
jgi:hypothetical protein